MSPASAAGSHVPSRILGMPQCASTKVCAHPLSLERRALYQSIHLKGALYLYVKTIERAHSPAHMWEKIKLSNNYTKALEQVNLFVMWYTSENFADLRCRRRSTRNSFIGQISRPTSASNA